MTPGDLRGIVRKTLAGVSPGARVLAVIPDKTRDDNTDLLFPMICAELAERRAAAFDACRWLIDTLKKTVPIWKKEHFADGAVWADGEAFPPEVMK